MAIYRTGPHRAANRSSHFVPGDHRLFHNPEADPPTSQSTAGAEITTGGTFRMIGNVAIGQEGKKLICVWLERMHDLREYQFTREILAHPMIAEH